MSDKKNTTRLTGLQPLAYMGTVATNPPQLVYGKSDPDMSNSVGFAIGSIWMVLDTKKVFMLTGLAGAPADWTQIYPETSETNTFPADVGIAESDAFGELNVFGGRSMDTTGLHQTLTIKTENDLLVIGTLDLPLLGKGFIRAGSMGQLSSLPDGIEGRVLIGSSLDPPVWHKFTSSDNSLDITLGDNSIDIVVSTAGGVHLTSLDTDAGMATPVAGVITVSGSTNINTSGAGSTITVNLNNSISVPGSVTGNGITSTTGDIIVSGGAVNAATSVTAGNSLTVNAGPIEFSSFTAGVVQSDAAGVLSSSNGTDGQVLIGGGANAIWANLVSSDSTVGIVNGPNSIDLENLADKDRILGDTGFAIPDGTSTITVAGGTNLTTAAGADTLTINLNAAITLSGGITVTPLNGTVYADAAGLFSASQGTDSQFYIGKTGAIPGWLDPVSENATFTITPGTVAGTLNFQSAGGGGVGTLDTMSGDTGGAVPIGGIIQIAGGDNVNVAAGGNTVTINLDKSIYQPTSAAIYGVPTPEGYYNLNGKRFLHDYAWQEDIFHGTPPIAGQGCTYVGSETGYDVAGLNPAEYNVGIGATTLKTNYPGDHNTAFGVSSLRRLRVSSSYNLGIGSLAGWNLLLTCKNNLFIKYAGGSANTENTIAIGQQGVGGTAQENCYIAGIWNGGALDITHREPVLVDQYGKVSSDTNGTWAVTLDGDLLIGSAPYGGMQRGNIDSSTNEVTVTNNPHSVDLAESHLACFAAYQSSTLSNITGDGTFYALGEQSMLNEYFDDGGNFYVGDGIGNPAYFQAPANGKYFFTLSIVLSNLTTAPVHGDRIHIYAANDDTSNWGSVSFFNPVTNALGDQSVFCSGMMHLVVGDKVYFRIEVDIAGCGKTIGIDGPTTHVSGFLVARD